MSDLLQKKSVLKVKNFLKDNLPKTELIILENTARSAKDAANALGKNVGAIVKSLSFKDSKNNFYLCLVSGDKYLSYDKLSNIIKDKVIKANAEEVKDQTGFSIGGVSPFVHLNNPKKTFIDDNLNKYETIYAAAGHPHVVFGIKFKDIVELSEGNIEDIVE